MPTLSRSAFLFGLLADGVLLRTGGVAAAAAEATLTDAYAQPATDVGVIYGTIVNRGAQADRLVGASSPLAGGAAVHRSVRSRATSDADPGMHMTGSEMPAVMRMEPVPLVRLPAHGRLVLAPGGYHLMLTDLRRPLRPGDRIPLRLRFARAGVVDVVVPVRPFAPSE